MRFLFVSAVSLLGIVVGIDLHHLARPRSLERIPGVPVVDQVLHPRLLGNLDLSGETPAPPIEGPGAPNGTATLAELQQVCDKLVKQLGDKKVVTHDRSLLTKYQYTQTHVYSLQQSLYTPVCIVYPTTTDDVQAAMTAIYSSGAAYGIRGGGHTGGYGWSATPGVLIDTRDMLKVTYDKAKQTVTYQTGCRWGDVYDALAPHNVTVVGGRLSNVGQGLALGGGVSHLSHQYGLASDNWKSFTIVFPNGKTVVATAANEYSDLFWAQKAGGNTFGVVTEIETTAVPLGKWWGGAVTYNADKIEAVLQALADFMSDPDYDPKAAISPSFSYVASHNLPLFILTLAYDGPTRPKVFDPFFDIEAVSNGAKQRPYSGSSDGITETLDFGVVYGQDSYFRTASQAINFDNFNKTFHLLSDYAKSIDGQYLSFNLTWNVLTRALQAASASAGGNPYSLPSSRDVYAWFGCIVQTHGSAPTASKQKLLSDLRDVFERIPQDESLPLYANYAAADQDTYGRFAHAQRFKAVKEKYDPKNFVKTHAGGIQFR